MGAAQRSKGQRIERYITKLHQDAGIPCQKVSRSGYPGEDLQIAGRFKGEVKARKNGFKTLGAWLEGSDIVYIKPDRSEPLVVMPWRIYVELMQSLPPG